MRADRDAFKLFLEKSYEKFGDAFDYSKCIYKNALTKMTIICKVHGEFEQTPAEHLKSKYGCPKCAKEKRIKSIKQKTTEEFISSVEKHFPEYLFDKVNYKTNKDKIVITCKIHGDFVTRPNDLLMGHGCPKCAKERVSLRSRRTTEEFISLSNVVHHNRYTYENTKYTAAHDKVEITCPIHGSFYQEANVHLKGFGCPKCSMSKLEKAVMFSLNEGNIIFEYEKTFDWLKNKNNLTIDFYLPDFNIGIECQGEQHFIPVEYFGGDDGVKEEIFRDELKNKLCLEHNIEIVYFIKKDSSTGNFNLENNKVFDDVDNLIKYIEETNGKIDEE